MIKRIGVYICHCGGNISDYVDVAEIQRLMEKEDGVVVAKHVMFACADSNQKEMIQDIQEQNLDAIVVASCSPKLHTHTFRGVASRAGLNQYNYIQANIREQCSWPHSDQPLEATQKAIGLIRAAIKKAALSEALENIVIEAKNASMVVGAGIAGMKAAIELARNGNHVFLIEKEGKPGGKLLNSGRLFSTGENGADLVSKLSIQVSSISEITLLTNTAVEKVAGSIGNFTVEVKTRTDEANDEKLILSVGSILVTTGFEHYMPQENEYGFGTSDRVITLPELRKKMLENGGRLMYDGHPVKSVAMIYCVGSRQSKGENKYCSRACCSSAIYTSLLLRQANPGLNVAHIYRDIRTYGKQEVMYEEASRLGDIFLKYEEKDLPSVEMVNNKVVIKVKDYLTSKKEMELRPDILVLVTGAVPCCDSGEIASKLKIPVGSDKFFNEIHPKLKPVETVINGVFIGGTCQGPKNVSESVQSSLAAVSKILAIVKGDSVQLEPVIATINPDSCVWCGKCAGVCDYDALKETVLNGKHVAEVNPATCKGCGICAPVCPSDAIEVRMYTNAEMEAMIDGFMQEVCYEQKTSEVAGGESLSDNEPVSMREYPDLWKQIVATLANEHKTIPEIALETGLGTDLITWHLMTMTRYNIVLADGMDKKEQYYYYKLKNQVLCH